MTALETIIRPFSDRSITPTPFTKPGQKGVPDVVVRVGQQGGGTKSFGVSESASSQWYIPRMHVESGPRSQSLRDQMQAVAGAVSGGNPQGIVDSFKSQLSEAASAASKGSTS